MAASGGLLANDFIHIGNQQTQTLLVFMFIFWDTKYLDYHATQLVEFTEKFVTI